MELIGKYRKRMYKSAEVENVSRAYGKGKSNCDVDQKFR